MGKKGRDRGEMGRDKSNAETERAIACCGWCLSHHADSYLLAGTSLFFSQSLLGHTATTRRRSRHSRRNWRR
jgi:hypothetical protein